MNPLTPEDLLRIDEVCNPLDWQRVPYSCNPFEWAQVSNSESNRIGPRHFKVPASNHDTVVNTLTLAGYSIRTDPDWVSVKIYTISKP